MGNWALGIGHWALGIGCLLFPLISQYGVLCRRLTHREVLAVLGYSVVRCAARQHTLPISSPQSPIPNPQIKDCKSFTPGASQTITLIIT